MSAAPATLALRCRDLERNPSRFAAASNFVDRVARGLLVVGALLLDQRRRNPPMMVAGITGS
jgi:hypothetical protein